jgi:hypothetical protein
MTSVPATSSLPIQPNLTENTKPGYIYNLTNKLDLVSRLSYTVGKSFILLKAVVYFSSVSSLILSPTLLSTAAVISTSVGAPVITGFIIIYKISSLAKSFLFPGITKDLIDIYDESYKEIDLDSVLNSDISRKEKMQKAREYHLFGRYKFDANLSYSNFMTTLKAYNSRFAISKFWTTFISYLGFVQKIEIPKGAKVFVRGDLHGDLKSLIKNLKNLQREGYLNEEYKVARQHRGKFFMVFLGDYIDRGPDSWKIFQILLMLKMNNPNETVLLRGNHENTDVNSAYMTPKEKEFYNHWGFKSEINRAFSSLPISAFLGVKNDDGEKQFVQFSHGGCDPDVDVNPLLESDEEERLYIRKRKPFSLSERQIEVLPLPLRNKRSEEMPEVFTALEAYIQDPTDELLEAANRVLVGKRINDKKSAKQLLSILKVQDFIVRNKAKMEEERRSGLTGFNWADIGNILSVPSTRGFSADLTPDFIKDYFTAISSSIAKVKVLVRGHQHKSDVAASSRAPGIVHTLPVSGGLPMYDELNEGSDITYLLEADEKVKEWKKEVISSRREDDSLPVHTRQPFYKQREAAVPRGFFGGILGRFF